MKGDRTLLVFIITVWCPVFLYVCWRLAPTSSYTSSDTSMTQPHTPLDDFNVYIKGFIREHDFSENDLKRHFRLNVTGSDIILYVRIQKTGSTHFVERLKTKLDVSKWCPSNQDIDCRKHLNYKFLLFKDKDAPFCGLHADFTSLQDCAEDTINTRRGEAVRQRHFYITTLRDPVSRYLSEWEAVKAGASWPTGYLTCNMNYLTENDIPRCYERKNAWVGVNLEKFMNCPHNLAVNRQTRMLANLSLVYCYNTKLMSSEERNYKMLDSAKTNLKHMAFFGLTEHQELSQILFENSFHLKFVSLSTTAQDSKAEKAARNISRDVLERIQDLNRFDAMLYQYAKDLFVQRILHLAAATSNQQLRMRILKLVQPLLLNFME